MKWKWRLVLYLLYEISIIYISISNGDMGKITINILKLVTLY